MRDQNRGRKIVDSAARAISPSLTSAQTIVVYSLDPSHLENIHPGLTDRTHFHGFPILGHATLWQPADLDHWRRTFLEGLMPSERVLCFAPRHGIRIHTSKATVDLLLCFECHKMRVFGDLANFPPEECFFNNGILDLLNTFLDGHRIPRDAPKSE